MSALVPDQLTTKLGAPLFLRYDGLDADQHQIEISDLASSLKGMARIMTVVGTFAANQRLMERSNARPVRVLVGPPEDGCIVFQAALTWVDQHQLASGTVSGLAVLLIGYVFKRAAGQKEEMKFLAASLEPAIKELGHRDERIVQGLLETINRMADILKPAAKQAVAPIGRTAGTLTVGDSSSSVDNVVVDKPMRDAIEAENPLEIGIETVIEVRFSEMNLDSKSCRISIGENDSIRTPAEITDPEFLVPNNAYAVAFAAKSTIQVRAKPTSRDGNVERWYISAHF